MFIGISEIDPISLAYGLCIGAVFTSIAFVVALYIEERVLGKSRGTRE